MPLTLATNDEYNDWVTTYEYNAFTRLFDDEYGLLILGALGLVFICIVSFIVIRVRSGNWPAIRVRSGGGGYGGGGGGSCGGGCGGCGGGD